MVVNLNNFKDARHVFRCKTCGTHWIINNKRYINFGQKCQICSSKDVVRSGIFNNKQRFMCKDCINHWLVPLEDLKQMIPENDRQYKIKMGETIAQGFAK